VLALIGLILCPYLIWTASKNIRLARESASWPTAPGAVTKSERTARLWQKQPRVTYSYAVDGKVYTSGNVIIGGAVNPKATDATLSLYPLGSTVTVHYSPRDHALAVLEPGPSRYLYAVRRLYLLWLVVIVAGQVLIFAANRWLIDDGKSEQASTRTYGDGQLGDGPASDSAAVDKSIRDGAEGGDAGNQGTVAAWYLTGMEGYPKDPSEAAKWYRKSAEQGDADSQSMLGLLYGTGNGVPKDLTQAVQWFQKAAAQGDPRGCAGLGRAYEKGLGGMPQDRDKAIEWYRKAGDNPLAKKGLERLGAN
jgi:hypothetical protein